MNAILLIINIAFCSYFVFRKIKKDKITIIEKGFKKNLAKAEIIELPIPNELKINEWLYVFMEAEVIIYISKLLLSLIIKKGLLQFLYFMTLAVLLILLYMSIVIPSRKITFTKGKYSIDKIVNPLSRENCSITDDFLLAHIQGNFFGTYLIRIDLIKNPLAKTLLE